jgi:hypothetical protein
VDLVTRIELAERSGSSPELIGSLVVHGILAPEADGSFMAADIQRVKLVEALERSEIGVDDVGRAVASGHLSFAFLGLRFTEPKGLPG